MRTFVVMRWTWVAVAVLLALAAVARGDAAANEACQAASVPLTVAQLQALMENDCFDCASYLPHLNTALQEGVMLCPNRVTAFLAQVRHETDGLQTMMQVADNGAGSIHMLPYSFRLACAQIPELSTAFTDAFPTCDVVATTPCQCGTDAQGAAIVQRPEFTFRVGVWWFVTGAEQVLGSPCADLREDADLGIGERESLISRAHPGTGFYKTSTCIFGFTQDAGLAQRVAYYVAARRVFDPSFAPPLSPHDTCTSGSVTPLSLPQLQALANAPCADCATHLQHVNDALVEADMTCPLRVAAFMAVVSHDTDGLTAFIDGTAAGAVVLPHANIVQACTETPALEQAFQDTFTDCGLRLWRPCECGTASEAAAIASLPQYAWRIATWWFVHGAEQVSNAVCGDLRLAADVGQGTQSQIVSVAQPGTGFYKIAACRFGFTLDAELDARVAAYTAARRVFDPSYFSCTQCTLSQIVQSPCTDAADTVCVENPNCIVSEWSAWTSCSVACGGGTRTRTRVVLQQPSAGGAACGDLAQVETCNTDLCAGACTPCASDQITVTPCTANSLAVCAVVPPTISPLSGLAPLTISVFTTTAPPAGATSSVALTYDGTAPSCSAAGSSDVKAGAAHFVTIAAAATPGTAVTVRAVACHTGLEPSVATTVNVTAVDAGALVGTLRSVAANFTFTDTGLRVSSFTSQRVFATRKALSDVLGMHRDRVVVETVRTSPAVLNSVVIEVRLWLTKLATPSANDADFANTAVDSNLRARVVDQSLLASLQSADVLSASGSVTLDGTASTEAELGAQAQAEDPLQDLLDEVEKLCAPECLEVGVIVGVGLALTCVGCYCFCSARSQARKERDQVEFIRNLPPGQFRVYDAKDGTRTFEHVGSPSSRRSSAAEESLADFGAFLVGSKPQRRPSSRSTSRRPSTAGSTGAAGTGNQRKKEKGKKKKKKKKGKKKKKNGGKKRKDNRGGDGDGDEWGLTAVSTESDSGSDAGVAAVVAPRRQASRRSWRREERQQQQQSSQRQLVPRHSRQQVAEFTVSRHDRRSARQRDQRAPSARRRMGGEEYTYVDATSSAADDNFSRSSFSSSPSTASYRSGEGAMARTPSMPRVARSQYTGREAVSAVALHSAAARRAPSNLAELEAEHHAGRRSPPAPAPAQQGATSRRSKASDYVRRAATVSAGAGPVATSAAATPVTPTSAAPARSPAAATPVSSSPATATPVSSSPATATPASGRTSRGTPAKRATSRKAMAAMVGFASTHSLLARRGFLGANNDDEEGGQDAAPMPDQFAVGSSRWLQGFTDSDDEQS